MDEDFYDLDTEIEEWLEENRPDKEARDAIPETEPRRGSDDGDYKGTNHRDSSC